MGYETDSIVVGAVFPKAVADAIVLLDSRCPYQNLRHHTIALGCLWCKPAAQPHGTPHGRVETEQQGERV